MAHRRRPARRGRALQPTANRLPESIIRAFARDPAPATAGRAFGSSPAIGSGEAATQTTSANAAAQAPSGESLLLAPQAIRRPPAPGACRCLPGRCILPGMPIVSPANRGEPATAPHVAAAGASVVRRLHHCGISSRLRRDRYDRAHAHPGSVPGGTDFLSGGVHLSRTTGRWRVCLLGCRPEHVLLSERSIVTVPRHIPADERIRIRTCRSGGPAASGEIRSSQ